MRATRKKLSQLKLLNLLRKSKPSDIKDWLQYLNQDGLDAIGEMTKNVLFCQCNLIPKDKKFLVKKLKPFKRAFKKIGKKRTSTENRRKLLIQHGSGLLSLLSVAVPILTSLLLNK